MDRLSNKPVFISQKLKENTNIEGDILCIECEIGYMVDQDVTIQVSDGYFKPKQTLNIHTKQCLVCEYYVLNDEQTKEIRKKLKIHAI